MVHRRREIHNHAGAARRNDDAAGRGDIGIHRIVARIDGNPVGRIGVEAGQKRVAICIGMRDDAVLAIDADIGRARFHQRDGIIRRARGEEMIVQHHDTTGTIEPQRGLPVGDCRRAVPLAVIGDPGRVRFGALRRACSGQHAISEAAIGIDRAVVSQLRACFSGACRSRCGNDCIVQWQAQEQLSRPTVVREIAKARQTEEQPTSQRQRVGRRHQIFGRRVAHPPADPTQRKRATPAKRRAETRFIPKLGKQIA